MPNTLSGGYKRDFLRRLAICRETEATPVEQVLCDYFSRSYREAAFRTAEEIAQETGVSKATVVRFASKLGFESQSSSQAAAAYCRIRFEHRRSSQ